jgi:hypothetical protein
MVMNSPSRDDAAADVTAVVSLFAAEFPVYDLRDAADVTGN